METESPNMPDLLNAQTPEETVQGKGVEAEAKKTPPKLKRPSKVFTEYYGSFILLLIALLVAAGYVVIKPKIDDYKSISAETRSKQQEIEAQRTYLEALSRSVAAAQTIQPDVLEKVEQALPRKFDIPELLVQLDEVSKTHNAKITSVTFDSGDKKTETAGPKPINLTLAVEAENYAGVKNFLNGLELSLRLFDVQSIALSGLDKDKVNFSLQMRTYYFPSGGTVSSTSVGVK